MSAGQTAAATGAVNGTIVSSGPTGGSGALPSVSANGGVVAVSGPLPAVAPQAAIVSGRGAVAARGLGSVAVGGPFSGPGPVDGVFRHHHHPPLPVIVPFPVPVPVPVIVPFPVPVPVPIFIPQPVVVYIPVPVPVPFPLAGPPPLPPPPFPILMSQQAAPFLPTMQNEVLPAISQVLPPEQFQDVPLQLLPVQPETPAPASLPSTYVLAHPLLFCGLDAVDTCEDLADQLDAITPGFDTTVMDGPNGYGMYLTYQAAGPAVEDILAAAPVQEVQLDDDSTVQVQFVLYCEADAASTCEDLADQLAEIDTSFGTLSIDGPQGYGVYLTYVRPD